MNRRLVSTAAVLMAVATSQASAQNVDLAVGRMNAPREMCLPPPGQQCWPSTTILLRNRNWHAVELAFSCKAYDRAGGVLKEAFVGSTVHAGESGSALASWEGTTLADIARVECTAPEMAPVLSPRR
jgi:hypothetical protein